MKHLHLHLLHREPGGGARPREGPKLRKGKRERARESKRFQDISSRWLGGISEMRCGGGWNEYVRSDSQVDPASCLTSSPRLQRPPGFLFSTKPGEKSRDYPSLSRESGFNSIKAVTRRWGQLTPDIGETPRQINYPLTLWWNGFHSVICLKS